MTRLYTEDHEWIVLNGTTARVGITAYAQSQLGDITFVELPQPGARLGRGDAAAVIDSVKAASDVYAPLAGTVSAINASLADAPERVNADPEGAGWLWEMTCDDPAAATALMDEAAYARLLESL